MAIRLLRLPEVTSRLGLGATSIYTRAQDGRFTPPIKLTVRASAWPEHEIDALAAAIIAGASDDELRALVRALVAQRSAGRPQHAIESRAHAAA